MPDGLLGCGTASAGPLAHVGVAEVEVGDDAVAVFKAEVPTHVFVVGDGARAPDAREAQGVGRELHVLDGRGAGSVVLQGLDLVAARGGDYGDYHGSPKGLLALAADPARGHLLVLTLGLGHETGGLGPGKRQLAASLTGKD